MRKLQLRLPRISILQVEVYVCLIANYLEFAGKTPNFSPAKKFLGKFNCKVLVFFAGKFIKKNFLQVKSEAF